MSEDEEGDALALALVLFDSRMDKGERSGVCGSDEGELGNEDVCERGGVVASRLAFS